MEYLREAWRHGRGWGVLPGAPAELHESALAVEALRTLHDADSEWKIAETLAHYRATPTSQLSGWSADELLDGLRMFGGAKGEDLFYAELRAELRRRVSRLEAGRPRRMIQLARIAASGVYLFDDDELRQLCRELLDAQRGDGGWASVSGEPSSLLATSSVHDALAICADADSARRRAVEFLRHSLGEIGKATTQDVTAALTVLADYRHARDDVNRAVEELVARSNRDGGWGGARDAPSTVEYTALAVISLVAAGLTSFVPTRLAVDALEAVDTQTEAVRLEMQELHKSLDLEVNQRCGEIARERDDLRERLRGVEQQRQDALTRVEDLERLISWYSLRFTISESSATRSAILRAIAGSFAFVACGLAVGLVVYTVTTHAGLITESLTASVLGALFVLVVILAYNERQRYRDFRTRAALGDPDEFLADPISRRLRRDFVMMSEGWPRSVRNEIAFYLYAEVLSAPPDIALRLVDSLAFRVGLDEIELAELRGWVGKTTQLSPPARRALVGDLTT